MIRRPPRSTLSSSSAASDVYKRQSPHCSKSGSTSQKQQRRSSPASRESCSMQQTFSSQDVYSLTEFWPQNDELGSGHANMRSTSPSQCPLRLIFSKKSLPVSSPILKHLLSPTFLLIMVLFTNTHYKSIVTVRKTSEPAVIARTSLSPASTRQRLVMGSLATVPPSVHHVAQALCSVQQEDH